MKQQKNSNGAAPSQPVPVPLNEDSALIISRMIQDEQVKKDAYEAAANARAATIASTAAAMGMKGASLMVTEQGGLAFVMADVVPAGAAGTPDSTTLNGAARKNEEWTGATAQEYPA